MGAKRKPHYRIVVMDSRSPRDGRSIEEIGYYDPIAAEDKQFKCDADKVKEWVSKGAKPTHTVRRLLNKNKIYLG
jgi:small subunit ribosomal protein S16